MGRALTSRPSDSEYNVQTGHMGNWNTPLPVDFDIDAAEFLADKQPDKDVALALWLMQVIAFGVGQPQPETVQGQQ